MKDKIMFWTTYLADRTAMRVAGALVGTFVMFLFLDTLSPGMPAYFWNLLQQCQCRWEPGTLMCWM